MRSSLTLTRSLPWFSPMLITRSAQSRVSSMWWGHLLTAKFTDSVRSMISKRTSGSRSIVLGLLDLVSHSALSRTITFLPSEEESTRKTLSIQLSATTFPRTSGKKFRVQQLTSRLGSPDTWAYRTRLLITKSSSSEERVPLLSRFSMDASYSMSKRCQSVRKESS